MKVLATGMEWFGERPGGLPRYFSDYLKAWMQHGEEVVGVVGIRNKKFLHHLPSYVNGIPLMSGSPGTVRQVWRSAVLRELSRQHFDVWNPHFAYYAWGAVNHPALRETPIVCHFHGPWAHEARAEHPGMLGHVRFAFQKAIERRVYRNTDQFIVLSHAFKRVLVQDYGVSNSRVHVIPGAVDVERFCPADDSERVRRELGLPLDRTIMVSVRRLANRMGLDRLITALSKLVIDFPKLFLVIVGTGVLEQELKSLVAELGLEGHVWFSGKVPDEVLPKYYQAADLSVVPSVLWEGFGLVTTESLACGTPVLATPIGGTPEILEAFEPGLIFKGPEITEIIDGLGMTLGRLDRLPTVERCRQHILTNFTWDVIIPQVKQVFERAMDGHGPNISLPG